MISCVPEEQADEWDKGYLCPCLGGLFLYAGVLHQMLDDAGIHHLLIPLLRHLTFEAVSVIRENRFYELLSQIFLDERMDGLVLHAGPDH